jgi:hypothetical protein
LGSGHFNDSSHSFSESFSVLIIERNVFQTTGAIWSMVIIGTICGILSYIALYFKEKCFKGSLNTYLKSKRHKNYAFAFNPCGYILISRSRSCHFLVSRISDIFKMLHDPFVSEFKNLCR